MMDTIERTIIDHHLLTPATPVVVMVSGGSDSTALAYLMADLFERGMVGRPALLHVNHKLRGEHADADQDFARQLADVLNMPFFACEIDINAIVEETGGNVEAIARHERYLAAHEALESLCRHEAVPVSEGRIATAHTQDDRVENFYMRSIVGTGPGGFRSMLYRNGPVVRPLMDVSRQALRDYSCARQAAGRACALDGEGNLWREDATNAHTDRFRAYVRHEMIPLARARNAQLLDTLCRSMNLIADEDDFLNELAHDAYEEHVEWIGDLTDAESAVPDGCLLLPSFGAVRTPLRRRVVLAALRMFLGSEARIETASIEAVLKGFDDEGKPIGGYVVNIQGDLAVSANSKGVLIEPMAIFRSRRKRV